MADETARRQRRPSGPQGDAETTDPGAEATTPAPAPDAPQEPAPGRAGAAAKLREAEHHLVNIQVNAPNPELSRVRTLIQEALSQLASSESSEDSGG